MKGVIQKLIDAGGIPGLGKTSNKYKDHLDVQEKAKGMKKGGTASARADGCAVKGKTKGRIV